MAACYHQASAAARDASVMTAPGARPLRRALVILRRIAILALTGWFVWKFEPLKSQKLVDLAWPTVLALWLLEIRHLNRGSFGLRVARRDWRALALLLAVFCAAWLPFYRNWRWAQTGDSIVWFSFAERSAINPVLEKSALSVHGPDDNSTFLSDLAMNVPMLLVRPTFFWHRVGKLLVTCVSIGALYAYFALILGARWAFLPLLCIVTNYVWIRYSYVSDHLIGSYTLSYLTLLFATLVWRRPHDSAPWTLCGLVGGLSLFFAQSAWADVAAVGVVLGVRCLLTRRFAFGFGYAASFVLGGLPVLLQWRDMIAMSAHQAKALFEPHYLMRIFLSILRAPLWSPINIWGGRGAVLPWPYGWLYVGGAALALIAAIPPIRRALRLPAAAPILLVLLLWNAVLMTLTNNAYADPSLKRTVHLIPIQVFLAVFPVFALASWFSARAALRPLAWAVLAAVVLTYPPLNVRIINRAGLAMYGDTPTDGLVELRQRFPDRRVRLASRMRDTVQQLKPGDFLDASYDVLRNLTVDPRPSAAFVIDACANREVLCRELRPLDLDVSAVLRDHSASLQRFPLLNATEMVCYECVRPPEFVRASTTNDA